MPRIAIREGALALLTWLLLQPPIVNGVAVTGAPLGSWTISGRHPSQQACERTRSRNLAALAYAEATSGTTAPEQAARGVIAASFCASEEAVRARLAPPTPTPSS